MGDAVSVLSLLPATFLGSRLQRVLPQRDLVDANWDNGNSVYGKFNNGGVE